MERGFRSLRDCVFHNPLGLSCLPSKTRQLADWYLPRDTGIEFEVMAPENSDFTMLSNEVNALGLRDIAYSYKEQAFRICSGEEGMIQLYKLSHILKKHLLLNPGSGIHYHTSCPNIITKYSNLNLLTKESTSELFLKELDSWGYKGGYNKRVLDVMSKRSCINLRSDFNTVEYRIGEMTFDYDLLIKRIVHCHSITRKIERYMKSLNIEKPAPKKKTKKIIVGSPGPFETYDLIRTIAGRGIALSRSENESEVEGPRVVGRVVLPTWDAYRINR